MDIHYQKIIFQIYIIAFVPRFLEIEFECLPCKLETSQFFTEVVWAPTKVGVIYLSPTSRYQRTLLISLISKQDGFHKDRPNPTKDVNDESPDS